MPSGKDTPVDNWVRYLMLRRNQWSIAKAAREADVNYYSARNNERGYSSMRNWVIASEMTDKIGVSNIPDYLELPSEVQECWDSIEKFALRYFGIILMPWQLEATETILSLLESAEEEFIVVNAPPGSGKSEFFTKILPAFATCRSRGLRGMIGSHTQKTAEWYTRRLRAEFERTHMVRAKPNDLRMGLAIDAVAVMQEDFGAFRPDVKEIWRAAEFTVLQRDDQPLSQKEPTWSAFGRDSGFLGGRFDLVLWDDLWDPAKMRNQDSRDDLYKWWDEVAETRLEPGGLLVLNGQRMGPPDIYRYALDKSAPIDDDEDAALGGDSMEDSPMEEGMVSGENPERSLVSHDSLSASETLSSIEEPMYRHLKYKAHYEDRCTGNHRRDSPPWPEGCLLFPRRVTWRKLRHIKSNTPDRYEILYQQEDTDVASVLVNPLWISGGKGPEGIDHVGCWDNDRDLWELPSHLDGEPVIVATADPSPANFWALQCWAYVGETDFRYLLEAYRRKMSAPEFLDWNHAEQTFSGVAEDWWQITNDMGRPIRYWIVEVNAAQKFILQYDHWKRWSSLRGVELIPHFTARNKGDAKYGVQMLGPLYRHGRVRLPGKQGGHARIHSMLLTNEVTKWIADGSGSRTDDQVMAQWFMEHNIEKLYTPDEEPVTLWRPSWMVA